MKNMIFVKDWLIDPARELVYVSYRFLHGRVIIEQDICIFKFWEWLVMNDHAAIHGVFIYDYGYDMVCIDTDHFFTRYTSKVQKQIMNQFMNETLVYHDLEKKQ